MRLAAKTSFAVSCYADNPRRLRVLIALLVMSLPSMYCVAAVASPPEAPALTPPVNHEVGRIQALISAADDGYRYRAYVLAWRAARIVVAGAPDDPRVVGDNLDVVVFRSEVGGHKILRVLANLSSANEDEVDRESSDSSAAITLGNAQVLETVSAESDGYRFVGYFVTWHDQRVFVVDPQSGPAHANGESINFRVLRTGHGASQRLSFAM